MHTFMRGMHRGDRQTRRAEYEECIRDTATAVQVSATESTHARTITSVPDQYAYAAVA